MQFSDTTNKTGLYQDACFRAGVDSNAYAIADFTRNANRWYYNAVIEAWKAQDAWKFDDSNVATNSDDDAGKPVATSNLTNSTRTYALPTGALRIRRVEVLDKTSNYQVLQQLSENQIPGAESEFYETDGMPVYYVLDGDKLRLFPAPDNGVSVTLTNGLRIFFDREIDEFTAADTTQEPGLPEPFHHIISLGAAFDFALYKMKPNAMGLKQELMELMQQFRTFMSNRSGQDSRPKLRPRTERYT